MSCILKAEHVSYTYQGKYQKVHALKDVSCTFEHGRFYAVVGRSGSGKTTLLSLLAGLDKPTQGEIFFEGKSYAELDAAKLRREKLSIVFQNFQLFPLLTVEENIMYPMELRRVKTAAAKEKAKAASMRTVLPPLPVFSKGYHVCGKIARANSLRPPKGVPLAILGKG